MLRRAAPLLAALLAGPLLSSPAAAKGKPAAPPVAAKAPVSDTYWGEVVTED